MTTDSLSGCDYHAHARLTQTAASQRTWVAEMIRRYQEKDLPELLEVWRRASLVAHSFLPADFILDEAEKIPTIYVPAAEIWVYVLNEMVVGFIALGDTEVVAIFVDPDYHGQGIGRALMDHARSLRGELLVDVFKLNQVGRRFYERYGFKVVAEYHHAESGQQVIRMRLSRSEL